MRSIGTSLFRRRAVTREKTLLVEESPALTLYCGPRLALSPAGCGIPSCQWSHAAVDSSPNSKSTPDLA